MAFPIALAAGLGVAGASLLGSQRSASQSIGHSKYQLDYQRDLANTAHQRQMADLRRSGLNPILSARLGGAGNVSPTGVNIPDYGQAAAKGMTAVLQSQQFKQSQAQVHDLHASADLRDEKALTEKVKRLQLGQQAAMHHAQSTEAEERTALIRIQQIAEKFRLSEREAEHLYWSVVTGAGKGAATAAQVLKTGKSLFSKDPLKSLKGLKR